MAVIDDDLLLKLLPESLVSLANFIGCDACLRLVETHGGGRVYIPKSIRSDSELASIGMEAAVWLSNNYGGLHLAVPVASKFKKHKRNCEITALRGFKSVRQIAQQYKLTERQVWGIFRSCGGKNAAAVND